MAAFFCSRHAIFTTVNGVYSFTQNKFLLTQYHDISHKFSHECGFKWCARVIRLRYCEKPCWLVMAVEQAGGIHLRTLVQLKTDVIIGAVE